MYIHKCTHHTHTYITEYYSAVKKKETYTNVYIIHVYTQWNINQNRTVVTEGGGRCGPEGVLVKGYKVTVT